MRVKINKIKTQNSPYLNQEVTIKGWVRSIRNQKSFAFIDVNDGSSLIGLQVVADAALPNFNQIVTDVGTGASVAITGTIVASEGKSQEVEMHAKEVNVLGGCDQTQYPLQKKKHTFEFLRTIAHLRPRTNTIGAVTRVRNALAFATHRFFQERGFMYVNTPIITGSDCEGAGEMFRVTTIDPQKPPLNESKQIDYSHDFFERPTYLTVSGQLNGEIYACALSDIYTFGPTFRAENSNTARHLAEFWMIEPEMAFADLNDNMDNAEAYLKYVLSDVMKTCHEDMLFFEKYISPGVIEMLKKVIETPFERATYSYAIRILEKSGEKFEYPVQWGIDLQTEHERYLTEEHFGKPVMLYDWPKKIKPFYMRVNDDGKTVAAMDVLVPKVGEIVGGSQREERYDVLRERLKELNLSEKDYWWYLELRKYGSVPHSGYGLGFERLVQFATGVENIRDAIPFPRYPGKAEF